MDAREGTHTSELKRSEAEAERVMTVLQSRGWTVCREKVPLQGQLGYYCVQTVHHADGSCSERSHSIRWNIFEDPLRPLTVPCRHDADLLSFVWAHSRHQGFDYFQYGDGDVGFVCYCRAPRRYSLVLRVSAEGDVTFSEEAISLLVAFDDENEAT
jgi:hypothetical protein